MASASNLPASALVNGLVDKRWLSISLQAARVSISPYNGESRGILAEAQAKARGLYKKTTAKIISMYSSIVITLKDIMQRSYRDSDSVYYLGNIFCHLQA